MKKKYRRKKQKIQTKCLIKYFVMAVWSKGARNEEKISCPLKLKLLDNPSVLLSVAKL